VLPTVLPYIATFHVNHTPHRGKFGPPPFDEARIVVVRNEADFLRVRLVKDR
jgi:hypothetical protein